MNIFNSSVREVICIRNNDSECFGFKGTGHLLTVGQIYTLTDVEAHSWHIRVTLAEFPGVQFNSVLFKAIICEEDDEE